MAVGFAMLVDCTSESSRFVALILIFLSQVHFRRPHQEPSGGLWWHFHRCLRHLPSVSGHHHLVVQ